jgi:hypothetical protein
MSDPHRSHDAMNPPEPGAHSAGTGGPSTGWKGLMIAVIVVFVLVVLALLMIALMG